MVIRILPNNLVNQIAAGEVVERPASVVKELVENAIDAGSTSIEITLVDGGKALIIVADNGKGMSPEELSLAVERHATSKLPDNDLFNINFLGFRGEALPSIASVARMEIISRKDNADMAYCLKVEGGKKHGVCPVSHSKGTRIEVRDLFYATPARLKFLKSSSAETVQVVDIVNRIAMANPHISFVLKDDNKVKINLQAEQGELFDARLKRLSEVMGKDFGHNSVLINAQRENLSITGYVSLPTYNKANSLSQYLFVNNRPVRDKLLLGAIKAAYQDVLPAGRYPYLALFFDISPSDVDVNVHPAKAEVRFYDNNLVRGLLITAIRNSLNQFANKASQSVELSDLISDNIPNFQSANKPWDDIQAETFMLSEHRGNSNIEYQTFSNAKHNKVNATLPDFERKISVKTEDFDDSPSDDVGYLGVAKAQFHDTYIISQNEDSIIITDQHAAHERIVMERLKASINKGNVQTQMLLIPEIVDLPMADKHRLLEATEEFSKLGLIIEEFGPSAVIIREIPALLGKCDVKNLIKNLAEEMSEWGKSFDLTEKLHLVCATIACHNSVRAGRRLNIEEMNQLLRDMENTPNTGQCNHGRPTYVELKIRDIAKLFDR